MPDRGRHHGLLLESTIDVVLWAIVQHQPITTAAIRARWGVCKSTACRWRDPLNDARDRAGLHTGQRYTGIRVPIGVAQVETRVEVHQR